MRYIVRSLESRLLNSGRNCKAVLLTGPRQVGKSTVLKHLLGHLPYITLDDPFVEEQARSDGGLFLALNKPPLVLDEIQRAPELFRHLKMHCDSSDENGLFFLSGSQQFHLMKNVSETMSGRIHIMELQGLSLREITGDSCTSHFVPRMEFIRDRHPSFSQQDNIWEIIHRGGYPALYSSEMEWNEFYADYVRTYLERDVRELTAVQDLDSFRKFMVAVAARTGQLVNYANIADEIGKDAGTVRNWMSILEASSVVYLLEPFSANVLKKAIKTPKLYFRDTGLASYLTRWLTPETLASGAMSGHMFETFVISEILKSFSNEGLDYRHYVSFYRGKDRLEGQTKTTEYEIDLIIEENGILYPVEIKQGTRVNADQTAAFQLLDGIAGKERGTGAVICTCPMPGTLRENVFQLPVWYV